MPWIYPSLLAFYLIVVLIVFLQAAWFLSTHINRILNLDEKNIEASLPRIDTAGIDLILTHISANRPASPPIQPENTPPSQAPASIPRIPNWQQLWKQ